MSSESSDKWDQVEAALRQAMAAPYPGRGKPAKRERVVLAERRTNRRVVRTLAEVEEQTGRGELLIGQLMGDQLAIATRLLMSVAMLLTAIPLVFFLVPSVNEINFFGLRLPWILLGLLVYPFFLGVAWSYNRSADRNEQQFAEMVER